MFNTVWWVLFHFLRCEVSFVPRSYSINQPGVKGVPTDGDAAQEEHMQSSLKGEKLKLLLKIFN